MRLFNSLVAMAASAAAIVHAHGMASFKEPTSGVTYSVIIEDKSSPPFAMLLSITAPINITWAGFATGGCMLRSPLLVAWPCGDSGVTVSSRWATYVPPLCSFQTPEQTLYPRLLTSPATRTRGYHAPSVYPKTSIAVFGTSSANKTHWTAEFACFEGCSEWYGGSVDVYQGNATFGYAISSRAVAAPRNATSPISFHNVAEGHFGVSLAKAKMEPERFEEAVRMRRDGARIGREDTIIRV
jgi:hypothetical protein